MIPLGSWDQKVKNRPLWRANVKEVITEYDGQQVVIV